MKANLKTLTDGELLSIMGEEEVAFTEIYARYWKILLAIAYNHTKDKYAAEECVQEVFISLWDNKDNAMIHSLEAYLATAVKFSVFKMVHRQKRRQDIIASNHQVLPFSLDDGMIDAKFLQEYIDGIIELLPNKSGLVFRYSRNIGLTIPEISAKMNIAEKTVEAHLTKALKIVRSNLKEAGLIMLMLDALFS